MCYWYLPQMCKGCSLKDKKGIAITNAFPKNLDESVRKQNKIWVDQGDEFYGRSFEIMVAWQQHWNVFNIQIRKICCCWEIFNTTKKKIYKHMTSASENICIDKYNSTCHETIWMKSFKNGTYIRYVYWLWCWAQWQRS